MLYIHVFFFDQGTGGLRWCGTGRRVFFVSAIFQFTETWPKLQSTTGSRDCYLFVLRSDFVKYLAKEKTPENSWQQRPYTVEHILLMYITIRPLQFNLDVESFSLGRGCIFWKSSFSHSMISRWWFQILFISTCACGNDAIWLILFSDGLKHQKKKNCFFLPFFPTFNNWDVPLHTLTQLPSLVGHRPGRITLCEDEQFLVTVLWFL